MDILKYFVLVISILVLMFGLVASIKSGDIALFFFGFMIACAIFFLGYGFLHV